MGQRFRLKADYDISSFPPHVQVILQALKTYGMFLADNGASWHISGAGDSRINDDEMHQLTRVVGADFEAVDETSLMTNVDSAQAASGSTGGGGGGSVPTGWVNLVSKNSGKCLELSGDAMLQPVQQYTCVGGVDQEFQFVAVHGGYKITVRSSGQQLDVRGGPAAVQRGAIIQQYPYWGGSNEIWTVAPTGDGYFRITANSSGEVIDVSGISKQDGAVVHQWTWWAGDNQKWSFVPAS